MSDTIWFVLVVVVLVVLFLTRRGRPQPKSLSPASASAVRKLPSQPFAVTLFPAAPAARNLDALPLPTRTIYAKPLLSGWERAVIGDLRRQLPPRHHLCPQARLLDMLSVQDEDGSRRQTTRNRLGSKSVDFAVIDPDGRVVLVIELNDRSHDRPDRQDRDRLVRSALEQAQIPLAVFKPNQPIDLAPWLRSA